MWLAQWVYFTGLAKYRLFGVTDGETLSNKRQPRVSERQRTDRKAANWPEIERESEQRSSNKGESTTLYIYIWCMQFSFYRISQ